MYKAQNARAELDPQRYYNNMVKSKSAVHEDDDIIYLTNTYLVVL